MTKKIFVWVAHPRPDSLCSGLADTYAAQAQASGAEVRRMNLSDMQFSEETFVGYGKNAPALEPDLVAWQDALTWADHILIVHPYWWGAMPNRAKAVIDRAMLPGFAFKYHDKGIGWDKLLEGRSADVIITSDTPPILDLLLYRKPGRRVITNQVLKFTGIKPKKVVQFGPVHGAKDGKISKWLKRAGSMGTRAAA